LIAATATWLVLVCTRARRIREARRSGGGQRRIPLYGQARQSGQWRAGHGVSTIPLLPERW